MLGTNLERWLKRTGGLGAALCLLAGLAGCGGDSGSSGPNACAITGCGGDIKGTWDITAVCAQVSSSSLPSTGVAACDAVARSAVETAQVTPMNAQITFTDTGYMETGTAELKFHYVYTKACLTAQGGSGASEGACNAIQSASMGQGLNATCQLAGETCVCDASETISMSESGTYSVQGTSLSMGMLQGASDTSPFCVKGDTAEISSGNAMFSGRMSLKKAAAVPSM